MTRLEAKDVLRSADGVTAPVTYSADEDGSITVSLVMSPEALDSLMGLAEASGVGLDDVISKAFVLYRAAADASREGKAVGIAPTADMLETEFVGF